MRLIRKEAKVAFVKESFHLQERHYNKLNKFYLLNFLIEIEYQREGLVADLQGSFIHPVELKIERSHLLSSTC